MGLKAAEEEHGETSADCRWLGMSTATIQRETRMCGTPSADKWQDTSIALAYEKWVNITLVCIYIMISSSSLLTKCEKQAVVVRQITKQSDL